MNTSKIRFSLWITACYLAVLNVLGKCSVYDPVSIGYHRLRQTLLSHNIIGVQSPKASVIMLYLASYRIISQPQHICGNKPFGKCRSKVRFSD